MNEPKGSYKFVGLLEQLALRVAEMDKKLDEMRTNHAIETKSNIAVLQDKVSRLENIVYGCVTLILALIITTIFTFIKHG